MGWFESPRSSDFLSMLTGQMWTWSQKDVGSDLSATTCFLRDLRQLFNLFES